MNTLPRSDQGYAVDRSSGTVHQRYARHTKGLPRTRTAAGAVALLGDQKPSACAECFPSVVKPKPAQRKAPAKRKAAPVRDTRAIGEPPAGSFVPSESGHIITRDSEAPAE